MNAIPPIRSSEEFLRSRKLQLNIGESVLFEGVTGQKGREEVRGKKRERQEGVLILADICRAALSSRLPQTTGCLLRARCSRLCLDPGLDGALCTNLRRDIIPAAAAALLINVCQGPKTGIGDESWIEIQRGRAKEPEKQRTIWNYWGSGGGKIREGGKNRHKRAKENGKIGTTLKYNL